MFGCYEALMEDLEVFFRDQGGHRNGEREIPVQWAPLGAWCFGDKKTRQLRCYASLPKAVGGLLESMEVE